MKNLITIIALLSFSASLYAGQMISNKQSNSEISSIIETKSEISILGRLIAKENDVYSRDSMIDEYRALIQKLQNLNGGYSNNLELWQLLLNN